MGRTSAVILAAGLGTRMKSARAKGLHSAAGMPLIWYPVKAAFDAGVDRVVLVVGHQRDQVRAAVVEMFPDRPIEFVVQERQLGTAHATLCARSAVAGDDRTVFINGDLPLLTADTIRAVIGAFDQSGGQFALLTATVDEPGGFGRIVRDAGGVARIVEARDATPEQREIREVNVGVYVASPDRMFERLEGISASKGGEFYFTDLVSDLRRDGNSVGSWVLRDSFEAAQVNDRVELAQAEARLRARKVRELQLAGVTIHDPESVMIDYDCQAGVDTEIDPCCEIRSGSHVGERCRIGRGTVISNSVIGDGVTVKPYCVFTDSRIDDGCVMGPFCHLRPASHAMAGAHVGNFVELKKTVLGRGSKANHLSYLGDCTIGTGANIGAGTITCNYDGYSKKPTEIGDRAFIGSDTQIVAPCRIGDDAYVAAGTTVVKDVPDGALAISRVEQSHVEGYAERKKAKAGR